MSKKKIEVVKSTTKPNKNDIWFNGKEFKYFGKKGWQNITKTSNTPSGDGTNSEEGASEGVAALMVNTTHSDLVALRDTGKLIPGMKYRITDYVATANGDYQVNDYGFDIIVVATDSNTISEIATAMDRNGTNYYGTSKVSAWKLWYSLDNDTSNFEWASENGKGVIFRMIDDMMNDAPFDFKNIKFPVKLLNGLYDEEGEISYAYTFNRVVDGVNIDASSFEGEFASKSTANTISTLYSYWDKHSLPNVVFANSDGLVYASNNNSNNFVINSSRVVLNNACGCRIEHCSDIFCDTAQSSVISSSNNIYIYSSIRNSNLTSCRNLNASSVTDSDLIEVSGEVVIIRSCYIKYSSLVKAQYVNSMLFNVSNIGFNSENTTVDSCTFINVTDRDSLNSDNRLIFKNERIRNISCINVFLEGVKYGTEIEVPETYYGANNISCTSSGEIKVFNIADLVSE